MVAMLVVVLAVALVGDGYRNNALGQSGTAPTAAPSAGRRPLGAATGPLLDLAGGATRSASPGRREVALTFDDGPDPVATPRVLRVLARYRVPATFFVVGSRVVAHPGLVAGEVAAGDEVGSHTFVHVDPSTLPGWRRNLELSLTQDAIAGATGRHTSLFRPPYSSTPAAATAAQVRSWRSIAGMGYTIVLADRDSEDWRRPGVADILANATPRGGAGAVILFHDGGGDRSQTVAALERLVPSLQKQGYRFVTVSELLGLPPAAVMPRASLAAHVQGRATILAADLGSAAVSLVGLLAGPVLALTLVRALILAVAARRHARRAGRAGDGGAPPVSVLVPAYNEEVGISQTLVSLAASDYPDFEMIVVDDGSTDTTAATVEALGLPRVRLLRQPNAGKAAALRTAQRAARHDLLVTVDADTVFAPDALRRLVEPFADPAVGAVSGNTKVGNRKGLLGRWQHIEYVMGFNLDRRLYELLRCMPTVPGAIGAFRRAALDTAGGFSDDTLAEDTDLTIAVNRAGWNVVYAERAVAYTEAPGDLGALWRQRYRWCYGTLQAVWKHRRAAGWRGGSPVGRRGFPYLVGFQVVLPLLAPVIDVFTLYGLVFLRPWSVLGYWVGFNVIQLALGVLAFRLDGERLGPLWTLPLQQFVYRQVMYLVVIQSVVTAAVGARLRWHKLGRAGTAGDAVGPGDVGLETRP